jgi:hypothetical protein
VLCCVGDGPWGIEEDVFTTSEKDWVAPDGLAVGV